MAIDHEALLAAIDAGKENSYGTDSNSELGARRARAIEAYLGLNTNPAPEGRSQVVDRSLHETVHTLLPSLVRIFSGSSDEICKFVPVGPDDELGAEQSTAVVNHIITQLNPWEQIFRDWLHDSMLLANGYAMAYWDSSDAMIRETYEQQSDDQLAQLVADEGIRVVQHSQQPDVAADKAAQQAFQQAQQQFQIAQQQWQMAAQQAQQQGQQPLPQPQPPQPPQPQFLHDVVIERRENDGRVCISVLPPEHCYVSQDTPDWTLRQCPYFEFRQEKTISDLRAMGLDVPEDISDEEDADSEEDDARNRFNEDTFSDEGKGVMRRVWARSICVQADAEGDNVSRLYYVLAVGRTILFSEATGRIRVASMTTQPMPHRHIGLSVADVTIDTQEIKTAVKRGGLDNLYLANSPRQAISSRVSLSDMLDSRPGGVIRMLDDSLPGEGHIVPVVHPFVFDQIIGSLEYFDQERQNRTGAMRGAAGLEANAMNRAAVGTTVAMQNASAMRVEDMARIIAPAVEYLFECVHELISKHQNKPLTIKLRGQWVTVDPQAWRTKRDVRISVGVGAGNKESMQQQLMNIFGAQMQLMPVGLAQPQHIHATMTELSKLAGFANPAKFWGDASEIRPAPPQPNPDQIKAQSAMQLAQFQAQQDQQKAQADQQIEQAKMQMQMELDRNREEMQARQKMLEAQMKAEAEQQKAVLAAQQEAQRLELERYKADLDASVKLQIAGMSNQTTLETSQPKDDPRVAQVIEAMEALKSEYDSPAEIVRGPDGKAAGVKRGERVRKIVRGPDGRAIGLQ